MRPAVEGAVAIGGWTVKVGVLQFFSWPERRVPLDVVYDGVGKDTYPASLDCLKPLGLFVSFGNASGAVQNFDLLALMNKGSLYATRPTLQTYVAKRDDLVANATELFDVVSKGVVKINVNHTYPLKDAAQAHRDLEGRKTTGSIVLLP